jgi:phycobilisome core-membrane linker protein
MPVHTSSPVVNPQLYQTLPTALISPAEQQDRWLNRSETDALLNFFKSSAKRLEIAETLTQHSRAIVSAAADRIFYGGSPMRYLESLPNRENLPGYNTKPLRGMRPQERLKLQALPSYGNPLQWLIETMQTQISEDRDPLPGGFRPINIRRYGEARMKRSMRDLSWFLRYVTYAIAAGDSSILTVNTRGLRGVMPEDIAEATLVSLREMRWRSLRYFKDDAEAIAIIQEPFDATITAYLVEKPPVHLRPGVSNHQQGLQLPESYAIATQHHRFVMKPYLAETEVQAVIKAAYRQVFERDITQELGIALTDLESRLRSGAFSTKEFIRQLGHSRLYRDQFYEPFVISRVIELAVRHFLGRAVSSSKEFRQYFEVISSGGLYALVGTLVDSSEYSEYFGEETVPYLRGLGQEAQECRNWSAQIHLFKYSAGVQKKPQFLNLLEHPALPNHHAYGASHDPLEIQFGAIFPRSQPDEHPAPFGKHQRILIASGDGSHHGINWGKVPDLLEHRMQLSVHLPNHRESGDSHEQGGSINLLNHSPEVVIQAAYRQVFGREVFATQRLTVAESHLKGGDITVRELIRQLAKSSVFRNLYWDSLYVTKAIEYIHRRLLGRPTLGRKEIEPYYDICAHQGFYALVDAMVNSPEYVKTFGKNTVPYERYVTPRGYEMRSRHHPQGSNSPAAGTRVSEGTWIKMALEKFKPSDRNGHSATNGAHQEPEKVQMDEAIAPPPVQEEPEFAQTEEPAY